MRITRSTIKKVFGFVFFAGIACIISYAQTLNFRGIPFEASPQDVIAKLGEPNEKHTNEEFKGRMLGDQLYKYNGLIVAGYSAGTEIEFENGKMIGAAYYFSSLSEQNIADIEKLRIYVNTYTDLLDKLTKLYGNANINNELESLGEGPISWLLGAEIEKNAPYKAIWDYGGGRVIQILKYENEKWALGLVYVSPEVKGKMDSAETEKKGNTEGL